MHAYLLTVQTALAHGVSAALGLRRTHVAFALIILPAVIPLLILVVPHDHVDDELSRGFVLKRMIETFYIGGITPLLALFFAAMLVRVDVESQTVAYLLTRPIPRTAWLAGKFLSYLVVCSGLIAVSILALSVCVLPLGDDASSHIDLLTLLRYEGVAIMALLGYGAISALLGAVFRHPVIIGAILFFGWQRIALLAPGATDFFTIQKYVATLLPGGGNSVLDLIGGEAGALLEFKVAITPLTAMLTLIGISAVCFALTGYSVRQKEYTTPVAVTD